MSQENVEMVKRGIDAYNRRDIDNLTELTTVDFAWFPALPGTVEVEGYHGRAGVETYFAEIRSTWQELRVIGDEIRDLGDERVLQLAQMRFRGRASGIMVESELALLMTIRDGKIVRSEDYLSHADALKAVGLQE